MTALRIVALDLSLTSTGIAATHDSAGQPRLACRTVAPRRRPGPNVIDHERLHETFGEVAKAVGWQSWGRAWVPDLVVIEWLPQVLGTGGSTLRLAELHGAVKHWLWSKCTRYVDIKPQHLKTYATGKGNANKELVLHDVRSRYSAKDRVNVAIGNSDEADAFTLLALALDAYGQPISTVDGRAIEVPLANRKAVAAVDWPDLNGDH